MLNFKSKKLMISLMAISVVILLVLVSLIRDDTKTIDYKMYETLLQTNSIKKAKIEFGEVILYATEGKYSIVKDAIDIKELVQEVPVEIVRDNPLLQELLVVGLLFIMIVFLVL